MGNNLRAFYIRNNFTMPYVTGGIFKYPATYRPSPSAEGSLFQIMRSMGGKDWLLIPGGAVAAVAANFFCLIKKRQLNYSLCAATGALLGATVGLERGADNFTLKSYDRSFNHFYQKKEIE